MISLPWQSGRRDVTEVAAGRGLRAARIRAIKIDISQNLPGEVTAAVLSARLSPRYICKLFEGEARRSPNSCLADASSGCVACSPVHVTPIAP
jgi:hypothetical protein